MSTVRTQPDKAGLISFLPLPSYSFPLATLLLRQPFVIDCSAIQQLQFILLWLLGFLEYRRYLLGGALILNRALSFFHFTVYCHFLEMFRGYWRRKERRLFYPHREAVLAEAHVADKHLFGLHLQGFTGQGEGGIVSRDFARSESIRDSSAPFPAVL